MVVAKCELEFRLLLSDAAVELFEPRRFTATRRPLAQLRKRRPPPQVDRGRELRRSSQQVAVLSVPRGLLAPSARTDERRYRRLMPAGHIRLVGSRSTIHPGAFAGAAPRSGAPCCSTAAAAHPTVRRRADQLLNASFGHAASAVNTTRSFRPSERDIAGWTTYLQRAQNPEMNRSKRLQRVTLWGLGLATPERARLLPVARQWASAACRRGGVRSARPTRDRRRTLRADRAFRRGQDVPTQEGVSDEHLEGEFAHA